VPVAGLTPPQETVPVDDEGGAVRHVAILIVHAVGADGLTVDVAQERERKAPGLAEGIVGEGAVPADRQEDRVALLQLTGDLSQAGQLGSSDAPPVVAVEADDDVRAAPVLLEGDRAAEGRGERESRRWLAPPDRVHAASLTRPHVPGQLPSSAWIG
jgi:hypothetical protein